LRPPALAPQLKRDPLGAMLDLRLFFDPKALNEPVVPWVRLPLAVVVAAGFGLCLGIALDTVRHWADQPHAFFQLAFLTAVGLGAAVLAVRLLRGDPIVKPVQGPPRPFVVRILGLVMFVLCGPAVLVSTGWLERIELIVMTLGGLGLLLAPKRFFPPRTGHGA